jgi:hypothetical protein
MKKATATSQGNKAVTACPGAGLSVNVMGTPGEVISGELKRKNRKDAS